MPANPTDIAPTQIRSLTQRLCGRWLISWKLLIVNISLSLFIIIGGDLFRSGQGNSGDGFDRNQYVTYWMAGYVLVVSFAAIMHLTLFKNRALRPVPFWMAITYQFVFSMLFTVSYQLGCQISGLVTRMEPQPHAILVFSICIFIVFSSTAIADIWDEVSGQYSELIERRVQVLLLELNQKRIQENFRNELNNELEAALEKLNKPLVETLQSITNGLAKIKTTEISKAIRISAEDSVRPLSKSLWHESAEMIKRPPLGKIVAIALRENPIPTFWLTGLIVITQSINPFFEFGFLRGFLLFVFTAGLTITITKTANAITKREPKLYFRIYIGVFLLLQTRRFAAENIFVRWGADQQTPTFFVTQLMINAVGFVLISTFGSWRQISIQALNRFQLEIKEQQIAAIARNKQTASVAREMSRVLHGAVQTRLVACAMMIDNSSKSGDEVSLNLAMLEALSILQAPLPTSETDLALGAEVARKISLWQGLCKFDIAIDPRLVDVTNPEPREIGRIVEEGISNAIRHGGASKVSVSVMSGADGSVVVQIDDNGSGIGKPGRGKPGIGSAIFASATGGSWSLNSLESGARLLAVIPSQKI